MKRSTLYILIISMALAFTGLTIVQIRYIRETAEMIENQFNESVQRSLLQTVNLVEENEALAYLGETLDEYDFQNGSDKMMKSSGIQKDLDTKIDSNSVNVSISSNQLNKTEVRLSTRHGKATIEETSKYLQEKFKKHFSRSKTILDQAVYRWMHQSEQPDISQRVNFDDLNDLLESTFKNNGIDLPFYYSIVTESGESIYDCHKEIHKPANPNDNNIYTQQFFPQEENPQKTFVQVTFPTKKNYIISSMSLMFPTLILLLLILCIFIAAIIVIYKQKQLNLIKNDFVNNMTHELKTPISSISLASQMLQDSSVGKTPESLRHISNVIRDETKRLSFMVEKVLQMAIFEKEKSLLKLREVHINQLIQETTKNFSLRVTNKGGKITSNTNAINDLAYIDEVHFTNVIFNLMDNALKYSDKDLLLTVETWNEKDRLMISIEDNGIGIHKEDHKRIFEKFYRVSTGNLHNVKGFGLGLAYVKKIINEHGGQIKVDSELNIGTKFTISLPTH